MTYTNAVLTIIAAALLYLCLALTPWPRVHAQPPAAPNAILPGRVYLAGWIDAEGKLHHLPGTGNVAAVPVYQINP